VAVDGEVRMDPNTWPDGYTSFAGLSISRGRHSLRPIIWADRTHIRRWRNEQISVLRQREPLSVDDQDQYFEQVVAVQMRMSRPPQVLFGYLENGELVGYGGLVYIVWEHHRAEVSFLTEPGRATGDGLRRDWMEYLDMLTVLAGDVLDLHKLTTETYETRSDLPPILEEYGFVREGVLADQYRIDGQWCASIIHGLILNR